MFCIKFIPVIAFTLVLLSLSDASAQSIKTQQGAVLKLGSNVRISGALIQDKRSTFTVASNQMGIFNILASPGDTLEISAPGYTAKSIIVSDFKDAIVYLIPITQLDEVIVNGKSLKNELQGIKDAYRSQGVYYNGKPPVLAAIVHPLSAINELFGKTAKRARRFNEYAGRELDYQEVSQRFNDLVIKKTVPIKDEELTDFRDQYMPAVEQIRKWNDYDLALYIKTSFNEFRDSKKTEDK